MFERIPGYYNDARANERVFREILDDIKTFIDFVPGNLDTSMKLEDLLATLSSTDPGQRRGKFVVLDFRMGPYKDPIFSLGEGEVMLAIQNMSILSGSGAILRYAIKGQQVTYIERITQWKS